MGYSNNIRRKILIILMIINLCFILFAKITKSFGAYSISYNGIDIPITDSFINTSPYYAIFATEERYDFSDSSGYYFFLVRSNSPIKAFVYSSGSTRLICYNREGTGIVSRIQFGSLNNTGFPVYMSNTEFTPFSNNNTSVNNGGYNTNWNCLISNHNIVNINDDNDILFPDNTTRSPSFDNVTEIKNGYPDGVFISPNDLTANDNLYFHLLRIDNTVSNSDTSIYYYSDSTFLLNKDSDYYRTWLDPSIEGFYYYIPRYNLKLSTDTSYLYVLNNSPQQIQNSYGIYSVDIPNGIYDVVQSDTSGVITSTEEQTDIMKNMEEQSAENNNSLNDINNTLNDTNVSSDTETNIEDSLNFNNKNEGLNNLNNGFFTRLSSMLSNLLGYNLAEDTSVSIPFPNSEKHLILHSKDIYDNITGSLRVIINAFWTFIFTFYLWKFINKIYISVSSGNILDSFSSSGEAITNDML